MQIDRNYSHYFRKQRAVPFREATTNWSVIVQEVLIGFEVKFRECLLVVNPLNPKIKFEFSFVVPIHFLQK